MRMAVVVLVVAACGPQPSYYNQPQQPGYAQQQGYPQQQQPQQQQQQAGVATCPQVIGCYLQCKATECIYACESGIDPAVVAAARAMTQCSLGHQCQDSACQQTQCSQELAACTGQQSQAAVAAAPQQGAAAPPPAPAPAATAADYRVLMGKKFLTTGYGSSRNRQPAWYVLFNNGQYLGEIPFTGLYGVDARQVQNATYVDNGTSIQIGAETFTRGSDGMWSGGYGEYWLFDALDNAVLDGTFRSAAGVRIAFSRDGRFQTEQLYFMDNNVQTGVKEVPAGSGTYRIVRNTLMLTYSTGQAIWLAITSFESGQFPSPSTIYLAKDLFQRS